LDKAGLELGGAGAYDALVAEARDYFWVEYRLSPAEPWTAAQPVFADDAAVPVDLTTVEGVYTMYMEWAENREKSKLSLRTISDRKKYWKHLAPVYGSTPINALLPGYIMPYFDVKPTHPHFTAIQRIGATGILKGKGEPYQWANRTWFYPDSTVQTAAFLNDAISFVTIKETLQEQLTVGNALLVLQEAMKQLNIRSATFDRNDSKIFNDAIKNAWIGWGLTAFREDRPITRAELAVLLDQVLQPFQLKQINHKGQFLN
jgi:hypothetical protein